MQLSCIRLEVVTTSGPLYLCERVWDPWMAVLVVLATVVGFLPGLCKLLYICKGSILLNLKKFIATGLVLHWLNTLAKGSPVNWLTISFLPMRRLTVWLETCESLATCLKSYSSPSSSISSSSLLPGGSYTFIKPWIDLRSVIKKKVTGKQWSDR